MGPLSLSPLGYALTDLSLLTACLAAVAGLVQAAGSTHPAWARLCRVAFHVHTAAVLGILALLLYLLMGRQFQYYYPWAHASNELPMQYALACLWEGQEGSFLIWMVWHAVLGQVVLRTARTWAVPVVGVLAALQAVLATMTLGAQWSLVAQAVLLSAITAGIALWAALQLWRRNRPLAGFTLAVAALLLVNLLSGQGGWATLRPLPWPYVLQGLLALALVGWGVRWALRSGAGLLTTAPLVALVALTAMQAFWLPGAFTVGSNPFVPLRVALGTEPVFQANPDFIPANGNGLNPLLQNYWMVIHPPTLFLGFALTAVPFAFALGGLLTRRYTDWLRPATPWLVAAVGVLGVGILMGGYWAYETLNFGGFWNWDPVENASLVPWLVGVGALHATVAHRHGRHNLKLAYGLVMATFLLVLYSTFLTRSGILGNASVHSFTDLGMSGQLLILLLGFLAGVLLLGLHRWPRLPQPPAEPRAWGRAAFLTLASVVLVAAAAEILVLTSLPVINRIFGTRLATPAHATLFFYQWNVWFAVAVAGLSAVGQVVFWYAEDRRQILRALFRPFVLAVVITCATAVLLALYRAEFVYQKPYMDNLEAAQQRGGLAYVLSIMGHGLLFGADELMLAAALFSLFTNGALALRLLHRSGPRGLKLGGSLAHAGFAVLLVGVLASAGYESTVSVNLTPAELGQAFPEEARADNVLLVKGRPKNVLGYRVTYLGKRQAQPPLRPPKVIYADAEVVAVVFQDATGERFGLEFPHDFFTTNGLAAHGTAAAATPAGAPPDPEALRLFIEKNLAVLRPRLANNRSLYTLQFQHLKDSTQQFTLYPEAEVNESMGLVAHPDRRVTALSDLYVHVSSVPQAETEEEARKVKKYEERLALGDTVWLDRAAVVLDSLVRVTQEPSLAQYELVVRAKLRILSGEAQYRVQPLFIVQNNQAGFIPAEEPTMGMTFRFKGVDPKAQKIVVEIDAVQEPDDYITFKATRKPLINLVWLGALVMTVGFGVVVVRRAGEQRARRRSPAPQPEQVTAL